MDKLGEIEIRVKGSNGRIELSPDTYDIKDISEMLQSIEDILFPKGSRSRPLITYNIEEGSVRNIFKTSLQVVIGFSALLGRIQETQSVDFLETKTAKAFEQFQNAAYKKGFDFEIRTPLTQDKDYELKISPETSFIRSQSEWAEAEFYLYGKLIDAGGKNKANVHLDTEDYGTLIINADKEFLKGQEENILYKNYGIRAKGMQNLATGELDKNSLELISIIDYSPKYDENYLSKLINKAKDTWKGIDEDKWLKELRGGYES